MARPLRLEFSGAVYHVTSRGNARQDIVVDDRDRSQFLTLLAHVVDRYEWLCHAYCLMDNHYHLLIETPQPNLSLGMRQLNGRYTQAYNRRHERVGHLLQGRFTAILVEKEAHLLALCRYVVLNPVRAKLVSHPRRWAWSSYRATVGEIKAHAWLTIDWILGQFGARVRPAQERYRAFVAEGRGGPRPWEQLRGQIYLGSEEFVARHQPNRVIRDISALADTGAAAVVARALHCSEAEARPGTGHSEGGSPVRVSARRDCGSFRRPCCDGESSREAS